MQSLRQRSTKARVHGLFSAKLLFEFCVYEDGTPAARRLCEERIVLLEAPTARDAAAVAQRQGKAGETRYRNIRGQRVHLRFVGILELLEIGTGCEPNEVWWELTTRVRPMERRAQIIPKRCELSAAADERRRTGRG